MRAETIMQEGKFCYVTGSESGLDCHHIYFGNPLRSISDEHGFWVWLCHDVHMALHDRREPFQNLDKELKRECQIVYEYDHTRREFMELIGRSYL